MAFGIVVVVGMLLPRSASLSELIPEYRIKAGFLYKFLLFVEWPETAFESSPETITIGILGENPFGDAFKIVEGKAVKGRRLVIKNIIRGTDRQLMLDCQLLFIAGSEKGRLTSIMKTLNGQPVLTVGDFDGFIEKGGMINLVQREGRVCFEIDDQAARRSGLKIRSSLMRLAIGSQRGKR